MTKRKLVNVNRKEMDLLSKACLKCRTNRKQYACKLCPNRTNCIIQHQILRLS